MNSQTIITILSITLPILGAFIGYFIKHNIEKKKELINEIAKERRVIYQQFVNLIIDIFASTKKDEEIEQTKMMEELYGFYKKYVLYASPNVIRAFSDFFQMLYKQDNNDIDLRNNLLQMTNVMSEMRKDLGLNNKNLGKNGKILMRAILKDYDSVLK